MSILLVRLHVVQRRCCTQRLPLIPWCLTWTVIVAATRPFVIRQPILRSNQSGPCCYCFLFLQIELPFLKLTHCWQTHNSPITFILYCCCSCSSSSSNIQPAITPDEWSHMKSSMNYWSTVSVSRSRSCRFFSSSSKSTQVFNFFSTSFNPLRSSSI